MTPYQAMRAQGLHAVLIHDNTYKCSKYNLALGLFASVNCHGRTVMLAQCLVDRESTTDYEWAYQCWLKCVPHAPQVVFINADKAVQAAVPKVFPTSEHFWCLWHIAKNLLNNLQPKDPKAWPNFRSRFYRCQRQASRRIFTRMWTNLLQDLN